MKTETYDLKTNIEIGKQIFENLPNDIKPGWAGLILSRFDNYVKEIPTCIKELFEIIEEQENWGNAHEQFTKIRMFGLENKSFETELYLRTAELVAKVTYNASGQSAPFDKDSGHYIPSFALKVAEHFQDKNLNEEVKSIILIFQRNKKFKDNISLAKEFIQYKKIDDILWTDWDPIGVNDIAPRDEYQSYVPEIFGLLKSNANRNEIAKILYKLETENMGMESKIENCLTIADKILALK